MNGLYVLAFGTPKQREEFFGEVVEVSAKDRRECIGTLMERGYGKPPLPVQFDGGAPAITVVMRELPTKP